MIWNFSRSQKRRSRFCEGFQCVMKKHLMVIQLHVIIKEKSVYICIASISSGSACSEAIVECAFAFKLMLKGEGNIRRKIIVIEYVAPKWNTRDLSVPLSRSCWICLQRNNIAIIRINALALVKSSSPQLFFPVKYASWLFISKSLIIHRFVGTCVPVRLTTKLNAVIRCKNYLLTRTRN